MRVLLSLMGLLFIRVMAQGPYSILLETGDTIVVSEYYTKVDSFGYHGGIVAKKDVVLFWTPRERWTFTDPKGKMVKIKEEVNDPCAFGHVCATRFAENLTSFDSLPIPDAWRSDTMLTCFREQLIAKGVQTEENGDRVIVPTVDEEKLAQDNGGVAQGEANQVILRTGDTLFIKQDMYVTDTMLCWFGGGRRPHSEVLLLRNARGQFIFPARGKGKTRLDPPVRDLSMTSLGRIYANILFASCLDWGSSGIPPVLRNDAVFKWEYEYEVGRLVKRAEDRLQRARDISILAGALRGAAHYGDIGATMEVGTRVLIKDRRRHPADEPNWCTPMPE